MVSQPFHYLTAKLQKKAIQSSFLGGKIEFYGYFLTYLMFLPPNVTTQHPQGMSSYLTVLRQQV